MDLFFESGMSQPDKLEKRKTVSQQDAAGEDTQVVTNPAFSDPAQEGTDLEPKDLDSRERGSSDDDHHHLSSREKVAAARAAHNRVRISAEHKYSESPHHGAAFWSSERKDVPMYFGHQPEDSECKRFTTLDRAVEALGTITFVMLLPSVLGFLPFFLPLAGRERECTIPDASLASQLLSDEVPPSNGAHSNNGTLSTQSFPCAEIRTPAFLFYTCPFW